MNNDEAIVQALDRHDETVAQGGAGIWIGSEPTFTLASSEAPEWLSEPLGGDKEAMALQLLGKLGERHPGALALRSVGRQYAKERTPRWSFGLYERRDGQAVWQGPADPLAGPVRKFGDDLLAELVSALHQGMADLGWSIHRSEATLLVRPDGEAIEESWLQDEFLGRPSVHDEKTPHDGLKDPLADAGLLLIRVHVLAMDQGGECLTLELPRIDAVDDFLTLISALETAAKQTGPSQLILRGHPPPVDARIAWTTITPDPAVIEVNQAPQTDVSRFYAAQAELYAAADELGLGPWRAQYNGRLTDSGGGGQITLGGPSPLDSPFFKEPRLLPRLVRYLNHHPALSYRFATEYVGAASQSPRPDETIHDRFNELHLALDQLARAEAIEPEFLWGCLAPFLADSSGNPHRSELNIEKLWNPYLPGRGKLGLVEFRAFRMPHSAERAAALAALLRAACAMLSQNDVCPNLIDWGDELHDRFALPWYLDQDLGFVFADLAQHGLGLGPELETLLLTDPLESVWPAGFAGVQLELRRAVEFWPLVGDVASQEGGGSRLVDSSTSRLEFRLRAVAENELMFGDWTIQVAGQALPLKLESDDQGELLLAGLRYREFAPWRGLHPGVQPIDPIRFSLSHPQLADGLHGQLFGWQPQGLPYDGLPNDPEAASQRLRERLVTRVAPAEPAQPADDQAGTGSGLTLDSRWR